MDDRETLKAERETWEARAAEKGDALASVLFRGLPESVNGYIHERHCTIIAEHLLVRLRPDAVLLDLGCGYGRLSSAVKALRPDIRVVGVDFAHEFCKLYRARLGEAAVCADVANIPFPEGTFDGVLSVTALMYVAESHRGPVMARLTGLLRPGGSALFIEPGHEYLSLAARFSPTSATAGSWFTVAEFDRLGAQECCAVVRRGGLPAMSAMLPLSRVLKGSPMALRILLSCATAMDRVLGRLRRYSVHRWMLVERLSGE